MRLVEPGRDICLRQMFPVFGKKGAGAYAGPFFSETISDHCAARDFFGHLGFNA
jgi:hypothetical protein